MLGEEQQEIHHDVLFKLRESGPLRILINGSAGTGKTYLAAEIINDSLNFSSKDILVTAPTHDALNILKNKLSHITSSKLKFATIHSALQLKRVVNNYTGEITFTRDLFRKDADNSIYDDNYAYCIIDEASMLESKLVALLDTLVDTKIIMLGDIKQINPVGEDVSPVFSKGYTTYTLTASQRQKADNPILDISLNPNKLALKQNTLVGNTGYIFSNDLDYIIERIARSKGNIVYLGWTNKQVNGVNNLVRKKIFTNPNRFEKGETLIFERPYKGYTNRERVTVSSINIVKRDLYLPSAKKPGDVSSKGGLANCDTKEYTLYFINGAILAAHEDSLMEMFEDSEKLKAECVAKKIGWKYYYAFLEQIASLKHSYAITTHVSQGSTFFCTVVDVKDIYKNANRKEAARLLYTATTRSSNLTIFFNT